MKFRKKPVLIEAFRFGVDPTPNWPFFGSKTEVGFDEQKKQPFLLISTLEGIMRADYSDWVIQGVKGEIYPCKDEIFKATYEAVND